MYRVRDFSKLTVFENAKNKPPYSWHCILDKNKTNLSTVELQRAVALLKSFEGYLIKADGMIGKLSEANIPPKGSLIIFEGGALHCCPIDICFSIYLPLK